MPGALDCQGEFALVTRTGADFAAGANLGAVGQIAAELLGIFIVNDFVFVFAVDADAAHWGSKAALLPVTSAVTTTTAVIAAGSARTTGTAAGLIFHNVRELLLKLYSMSDKC